MVTAKERNAVISKFRQYINMCEINHPVINSHTEQWTAASLVESYGNSRLYELMEYYFHVTENPDWKSFSYNIDKIDHAKKLQDEDMRVRAIMREQAQIWLKD